MTADPGQGTGVEVWSSAPWRERAVTWLDEQLARAGMERTGPVTQPHLRPWATALTARTSHGRVWLKAAGPGTAFEVGLYRLLHEVGPDTVLAPIATDVARGWIVLPDGGTPLGECLTGTELAGAMEALLPRYGRLQRDLAPHAARLLELGVADMRPAAMPRRLTEALEVAGEYARERGTAADRATLDRVAALSERFAAWCDRLAAAPGAASIDHNDLHPWNVFATGADGADPRLYDWGDTVLAHPFASMLVALGFMRNQAGLDGAGLLRLRDAYLEAFSDLAPHAALVETLELACRVAKPARALTWARALHAPGAGVEEHARAPLACLESLLDDSYLGGA